MKVKLVTLEQAVDFLSKNHTLYKQILINTRCYKDKQYNITFTPAIDKSARQWFVMEVGSDHYYQLDNKEFIKTCIMRGFSLEQIKNHLVGHIINQIEQTQNLLSKIENLLGSDIVADRLAKLGKNKGIIKEFSKKIKNITNMSTYKRKPSLKLIKKE